MTLVKTASAFYLKNRSFILRSLYVYLLFSLFGSSVNLNIKKRLVKLLRYRKHLSNKAASDEEETQIITESEVKQVKSTKHVKNLAQYIIQISDFKMVNIIAFQIMIIAAKIYLNLRIISIDSQLVSSLFSKNYKNFGKLVLHWLLIGIPISYLSSLSVYLTNTLSKVLITNITNDLMNNYLSTSSTSDKDNMNTFYKINHFSDSIKDPHQRISVDIFELSNNLSSIPSIILNPFFSLAVSSSKLFNYDNGSMTEVTLLFGLVINVSTIFIKLASPNFSRISNSYSQHESDFRQVHANIINHYEQIALLRSWFRELYDADCYYFVLERFLRRSYRKFAFYNFVKTFLMKYTWGAFGLSLCAFPVFKNHFSHVQQEISKSKVTQDFLQNRSFLMSGSNSLGDLLSSKKNIDQIIGTSKRVIDFKNALTDLTEEDIDSEYLIESELGGGAVVTHNNDLISFKEVPLYTPNGQLLCRPLNFTINQGENLLILGPNGSGKSSLFRLLSGLWPLKTGELIIPEYNSIFYLPQRPYLLKGKTNLIEQIIYPKSYHDFEIELTMPSTDSKKIFKNLIDILKILELDYLLSGQNISSLDEGLLTFDSLAHADEESSDLDSDSENEISTHSKIAVLHLVKDWSQELSIGSQQKLAMARLYYHMPRFAVLDECTSQVTPEMENKMYTYATKSLNISVLSVAHRTSVWKFHKYLLQFDGKGGYIFKKFNYKKRLELNEEKLDIEKSLNSVPTLKTKLEELRIVKENQLRRV